MPDGGRKQGYLSEASAVIAFSPVPLGNEIGLLTTSPAWLSDRIGLLTALGGVQAEWRQTRTHLFCNPMQALCKPRHFPSKSFSEACKFVGLGRSQTGRSACCIRYI